MALFHGFKRRTYVSQAKESTYGADSDLTHVFDDIGTGGAIRGTTNVVDDAEIANNSEFAKVDYALDRSVSWSRQFWASPETVALFGAYALGDDAVSGATDKLHTITMKPVGTFPGSMRYQENLAGATATADTDHQWCGVVVNKFEITWGRTGFATVSVDFLGSGVTAAEESPTESSLDTSSVYFAANKINVWICPVSVIHTTTYSGSAYAGPTSAGVFTVDGLVTGEVSMGSFLDSARFTYMNNYAYQQAAGTSSTAGIYGVQPTALRRTAEFEMTYNLDTTSVDGWAHKLLLSDTNDDYEFTIGIEFISDTINSGGSKYKSAAIILPLTRLVNDPRNDSNAADLMKDTATFKVKQDTAGTGPVLMWAVNTEAAIYNQV